MNHFCTCEDLACPLHPTNYDKGCTPCINKNLRLNEIPSCFFNKVTRARDMDGYTFKDFAKVVLEKDVQ